MALSQVQEMIKVFEASNDAVCFGLCLAELEYLRGISVEPTVFELSSDCSQVKSRFNIMVLALDMSIFRVFGIVERYVDTLLLNAKILMKLNIDTDVQDAKNMIAQLSKPLNLQPEEYITLEDNETWLLLSRMSR